MGLLSKRVKKSMKYHWEDKKYLNISFSVSDIFVWVYRHWSLIYSAASHEKWNPISIWRWSEWLECQCPARMRRHRLWMEPSIILDKSKENSEENIRRNFCQKEEIGFRFFFSIFRRVCLFLDVRANRSQQTWVYVFVFSSLVMTTRNKTLYHGNIIFMND